MPGRYFTKRRSSYPRPIVNSITNRHNAIYAINGVGAVGANIAKAVTSPSPTVASDVSHGCIIQAIWVSIDFCGLAGSGVLTDIIAYLIKNPGANLTSPSAFSIGTSNEKKFVVKEWSYMAMRNQDGNPPYHWEGWVKVPKKYQRMGTDDTWRINMSCTAGTTGHGSTRVIYKWKR